jgi:hypothetical protein
LIKRESFKGKREKIVKEKKDPLFNTKATGNVKRNFFG